MDKQSEFEGVTPETPVDVPAAHGKQALATGTNTYSVRVTGRVQGVGYRDFVRRTADSLQVCGWVCNDPDGSVLAVIQSPETRILEMLIERLKQGPAGSEVDEVFVEQIAGEENCAGFEIRR